MLLVLQKPQKSTTTQGITVLQNTSVWCRDGHHPQISIQQSS